MEQNQREKLAAKVNQLDEWYMEIENEFKDGPWSELNGDVGSQHLPSCYDRPRIHLVEDMDMEQDEDFHRPKVVFSHNGETYQFTFDEVMSMTKKDVENWFNPEHLARVRSAKANGINRSGIMESIETAEPHKVRRRKKNRASMY